MKIKHVQYKGVFMCKLLTYFLLITLLSAFHLKAVEPSFQSPVDIPITLSGSFGELRGGHFHSGIDIRTNGVIGQPVRAVEKGYISRISVSPYGFGNALYVSHPNGYTSVYGHLDQFVPELKEYVRKQQYAKKQFGVNLYLKKGQFKVDRGEQIGWSGNSGSSGGPHLHFELRKTSNQHPVNPWKYFKILDNKKPIIKKIALYPIGAGSHVKNSSETSIFDVVHYNNIFHISKNPVVPVFGQIAFGIEVVDYINGSWSKCGVNRIEIKVDGKAIYNANINEIDYSTTRHINSHIDYATYVENGERFHKSFIEPGNKLQFYNKFLGPGYITFNDGLKHEVEIKMYDSANNESKAVFKVLATQPIESNMDISNEESFRKSFDYKKNDVSVRFDPYSFYSDFNFEHKVISGSDSLYSAVHQIMDETIPVQKSYELKIKTKADCDSICSWLLVASYDEEDDKWTSVGGEYKDGFVTVKTRSLGQFAIVKDDIAPEIKSLSIKKNALYEKNRIRFKASDSFTGISSYEGLIDNQWVLFEYDAKNDLFTYNFDHKLKKGGEHTILFKVSDGKENLSVFYGNFRY